LLDDRPFSAREDRSGRGFVPLAPVCRVAQHDELRRGRPDRGRRHAGGAGLCGDCSRLR